MTRFSGFLSTALVLVALATPAIADSTNPSAAAAGPRDDHAVPVVPIAERHCSGLAVFGFQESYPLQDLGIDASGGKPVSQNMLLMTCGKFSVDVWTSVQLTDGTYGHRGSGDEWDLELSYADGVETPFGKFKYQIYGAYYALDLGKGLADTGDDFVQIYGEVSRPFQVGQLQVTPFVRYIHLFAIGGFSDLDFMRAGLRLTLPFQLPLMGKLTAQVDASHTSNLDESGAVTHPEVWRGEATLTRNIGSDWFVAAGAKFTEFVGTTPLVKIGYSF